MHNYNAANVWNDGIWLNIAYNLLHQSAVQYLLFVLSQSGSWFLLLFFILFLLVQYQTVFGGILPAVTSQVMRQQQSVISLLIFREMFASSQ